MLRFIRRFTTGTRFGRRTVKDARNLRNRVLGITMRAWPGRSVPGLLSVVVPVYNVERYVGACLKSLRRQKHPWTQIIVVDDGSPDDSISVLRRHASKDPRVRIVRQSNRGLSAARNTGARFAKGEYLTFVDSDDTVAPGAYRSVIRNLRSSRSDFAVMGYQRKRGKRVFAAAEWIRAVHARPQLGATLAQRPDVQLNAVAWSKIYRASFYRDTGLSFPDGVLYEDQPVSAEAYARATAFDISSIVGVNWRIREDETSISQQGHDVANMTAQMDAGVDSLRILAEAGQGEARQERALQLLSNNLGFYNNDVARGNEEYFAQFRTQLNRLWDIVGDERILRNVPIRNRLFYQLVRAGDRAHAIDFLGSRVGSFNHHRVTMDDHGYTLDVAASDLERFGLTPGDVRLHDVDLSFVGGVRRIWFDDDRLWVQGWAYIAGVMNTGQEPRLDLWFGTMDASVGLEAEYIEDPFIDGFSGHRYLDYRWSGFQASLPIAEIPKNFDGAVLYGRAHVAGVVKEGTFYRRGQTEGGRTAIEALGGGRFAYLSAIGGRPLTLTTDAGLRAGRNDMFALKTPATLVEHATDDEGITMRLRLRTAATLFVLEGSKLSVHGDVLTRRGSDVTVRFPLRVMQWGVPDVPLPSGSYFLRLGPERPGISKDVWLDEGLARRTPLDVLTVTNRVNLRIRNDGERPYAAWEIGAPIPVEERGARNQQRMIETYQSTPPSHEAFFVRSLYGEVANCNPKGLQEEITRRGLDLPVYWSVADHSVVVPAGGIPVVQNTADWHRLVRASRYLMVNVHQHPWYRKVDGQKIIETFHGYPYKQMGHDWWRARDFDPAQVAEFDRRARDWDYVVSPATYATDLLRDAFVAPATSDAEMIEVGYPRNDVFFRADELHELRERTRRVLGIEVGKTVVLYAPTFRDYLSVDDMTADNVDFLDPSEFLDRLGEDHVLLMRGHPFNARSDRQRDHDPRIIDATSYPDINDLIAASDAAVLDYSSLRFDYALTGKPMAFFVPDVEKYHALRPGLADYASTAPGPLITNQDELVTALGDLDALGREWAAARATFVSHYADLDDGSAAARLLRAVGAVTEA